MTGSSHLWQKCKHTYIKAFLICVMKPLAQNREKRAELSALMTVLAVLAVGTIAKLDLATQLFRLAY